MKYGLIGEKLGHSFSKIIHSELTDYDYELKEVAKDELDSFMRKADFKAINVTIPYKQDVIPYLYEIDETAKAIGAVNTIVNKNGKLYGYNTDFLGLKSLIENAKITIRNKKVIILGSGGTSKTALAVAKSMGAKEVYRVSRKGGNGLITYNEAENSHNDAEVIINTTPCGMYPNIGEAAVGIDKFTKLEGVVDAIYNPLNSFLVTSAKEKGIAATGGLYMLVAQAVFAAEKFTDSIIDKSEIDRIYNKIFNQKRNLVLIGMPSCGKTTIGKAIAEQLGKEFIDSDDEIVKKQGMPIPEIFEKFGEKHFRNIESEVIAELSLKQSSVIATGGGAVLNRRNVDLLKENGLVVFIDRPLEKLITTDDRPLSSNRELLTKRYNERYDIYCSSADIIVNSDCDLEENIGRVKEAFLNENSCN
ncbi:MAG: shikimate dehydrogenase [Ruminococcaceae bacterium]|nr:shikimate dehydrogenase [Oscillospiraceae bacterium]